MPSTRVLVIESNPEKRKIISDAFNSYGFFVTAPETIFEIIQIALTNHVIPLVVSTGTIDEFSDRSYFETFDFKTILENLKHEGMKVLLLDTPTNILASYAVFGYTLLSDDSIPVESSEQLISSLKPYLGRKESNIEVLAD